MALRLRIEELIAEKNRRDGTDLTPTQIAASIGVSHNTIWSYVRNEAGQPKLEILEKLMDYFECTPGELFEDVESSPEYNTAALPV